MDISKVDVVIGLQYGDEGKGKIASQMAASGNYDCVVRFNGGANAGHTIYKDGKKIVTHLVPCGVLHGILSIIGPGCVVNIDKFFAELNYLKENGFDTSLVKIARNAHIVTSEHIDEDSKDTLIGTTKTGNGPCYRDKFARTGHRVDFYPQLEPYLIGLANHIYSEKRTVLAEGAQGYWLDIDFGDYPYVTSSNCGVGALINNGFSPKTLNKIIGVSKSYSTYVGNKPYSENNAEFDKIREVGEEFGATTGRPRQIDWLSIPEILRSAQINGIDKLIINKMDVLRSIGNVWKFYDVHNLINCNSEEGFMNHIINIFHQHMPNVEVEFQGSPE
jgi:adenylosuccinate synthase